MKSLIKRLWKDESGLSILEYAIGAAVVAFGVKLAIGAMGNRVSRKLNEVYPDQ